MPQTLLGGDPLLASCDQADSRNRKSVLFCENLEGHPFGTGLTDLGDLLGSCATTPGTLDGWWGIVQMTPSDAPDGESQSWCGLVQDGSDLAVGESLRTQQTALTDDGLGENCRVVGFPSLVDLASRPTPRDSVCAVGEVVPVVEMAGTDAGGVVTNMASQARHHAGGEDECNARSIMGAANDLPRHLPLEMPVAFGMTGSSPLPARVVIIYDGDLRPEAVLVGSHLGKCSQSVLGDWHLGIVAGSRVSNKALACTERGC